MDDIRRIKDEVEEINKNVGWTNDNLLHGNRNTNYLPLLMPVQTILLLLQSFFLMMILWRVW